MLQTARLHTIERRDRGQKTSCGLGKMKDEGAEQRLGEEEGTMKSPALEV